MTLDEMEKFAAGVIQDAEVLGNSLVPMHPKRHVPLARFVLLVMPVVKAAMQWRETEGVVTDYQQACPLCAERDAQPCCDAHMQYAHAATFACEQLETFIDSLRAAMEGK